MQGSRSGVHPTYSGLTPWGGQTCTRVRDVKGVSNSTLDGSFWLHTVGTLVWFAEDENWASISGCGDSLAARQRVELGLDG